MNTTPSDRRMLQRGDSLPMFEVATLDRGRVRYADLWQRRNIVLVCLPPTPDAADSAYARELARRSDEFEAHSAACLVTREPISGLPCPGVVIADRWGEIQYLASSADLPDPQELFDTLDYEQRRCPECEGEWR